jgi:hypothetical protein
VTYTLGRVLGNKSFRPLYHKGSEKSKTKHIA